MLLEQFHQLRAPGTLGIAIEQLSQVQRGLTDLLPIDNPAAQFGVREDQFKPKLDIAALVSVELGFSTAMPQGQQFALKPARMRSFITRLHPCRFPGSGARKMPSSTNNLLGWVLPPLVICAFEARTVTASFSQNAVLLHEGGNKYNAAMNMRNSRSMGLLLCLCSIIVAQPQYVGKVVESIELRGTKHLPPDSLKPLLATKVGDVYNAETLGRDAAALWETGWFSAIELKPEPGDHGGIVARFVVGLDRDRPQSVSVIDAVEVRGVKGIPDNTLKGLITVKAGGVYNEQALGRDLAALWASGMFSGIQLRKDRGSSGGVVIRFALTEPQ